MNKLDKIISEIENFAPPELTEEWDNSGWQVYLGNRNINKVMLAISPTVDVVDSAVKQGCELLVTHHPLIFSKFKSLSSENFTNLPVLKAIQNNLQVYCAHTNLDAADGGVAEVFAKQLDLQNITPVASEINVGRKGEFSRSISLSESLNKIKIVINTDKLKLINPAGLQEIKTVAVLPGSGGSFIPELKEIDLYITGDVKYHDALLVKDFAVVDAGHFETEKIILPVLKELLEGMDIETFIAEEGVPWVLV